MEAMISFFGCFAESLLLLCRQLVLIWWVIRLQSWIFVRWDV